MAWYHLSGSRSYVGDGVPLRIRDTEIEAWSKLRDEPLSPMEMRLFDVIETTWLDVMRNKGAPSA